MSAPVQSMRQAFEQGRKDCRRGLSRNDCRYSRPQIERAWLSGWDVEYRQRQGMRPQRERRALS